LAKLKVPVPRVKSYKYKAYLKECTKERDAAIKAADPKLPVTKFTEHKKQMAKQAISLVEVLE
jgi:hypothetical protein